MSEKSKERLVLGENQVVVLGEGGFAYVRTLSPEQHAALREIEALPPCGVGETPSHWSEWEW